VLQSHAPNLFHRTSRTFVIHRGPRHSAKDLPRPTLIDDDQLKLFQKYLAARMYPTSEGAPCSPCDRYEISATVTGMVNFPVSAKPGSEPRNSRERLFFLQSLAGVTARDLSATYDPTKYSTEPSTFPHGYVSGRLLGRTASPCPRRTCKLFPPRLCLLPSRERTNSRMIRDN